MVSTNALFSIPGSSRRSICNSAFSQIRLGLSPACKQPKLRVGISISKFEFVCV